jgi:hypothetical protein
MINLVYNNKNEIYIGFRGIKNLINIIPDLIKSDCSDL